MREQACAQVVDEDTTTEYFLQDGVLCRRWLPPVFPWKDASWAAVEHIVVPEPYRQPILQLAHDGCFAGHLGACKTYDKLNSVFYWPGIQKDIIEY